MQKFLASNTLVKPVVFGMAVSFDENKKEDADTPTVSPAAQVLAAEAKVDVTNVVGTGTDGTVTKGDVAAFIKARDDK